MLILIFPYRRKTFFTSKSEDAFANEYKVFIIEDILNRVVGFLENGIHVTFVFEMAHQPSMRVGLDQESVKITRDRAQMMTMISTDVYTDIKALLRLLGIKIIETDSNIHEECYRISKELDSIAVVSEDLTFLAFGVPALIRYIDPKKGLLKYIHLESILKSFKIQQEQFSDLCILCGWDYTASFDILETAKIFEFIQKYNNIECILRSIEIEAKSKYDMDNLKFLDNYNYIHARKLMNLNKTEHNEEEDTKNKIKLVSFEEPDLEKAYDFLTGNVKEGSLKSLHTLQENFVTNILLRINKENSKLVQKKL